MVGVKGKYKGCNTCRGRRVKCDNTRPFCRNCIDHGRACEGYERETVFIVGTVNDKGRCASHPPRNLAVSGPSVTSAPLSSSPSSAVRGSGVKLRKKKTVRLQDKASFPSSGGIPLSSSSPASAEGPALAETDGLAPCEPWTPAWSNGITLGSPQGAGPYRLRFLAIRTRLGAVVATAAGEGGNTAPNGIRLSLPSSCRASERPRFHGPERFRMASQCFLRLPRRAREGQPGGGHPGPPDMTEEGLCLFLYEQNFSAVYNNPLWKASIDPGDDILARGPAMFQTFPAHHFFALVYRPIAILTTLLTRTPSPLAAAEWTAVPYERHPPTPLDALLDMVAQLPDLLARADRLPPLTSPPAVNRCCRLAEARDLVACGAALEARFAAWYAQLERAAAANRAMPLLYWTAGSVDFFALAGGPSLPTTRRRYEGGGGGSGGADDAAVNVPFADTYEFASTVVGLSHVVYWTALMTLYECMDGLVPVVLGRGEEDVPASGPAPKTGGVRAMRAAASDGAPELPSSCNPARYQARERRKLAANVCRSLDWVIGSSAPEASSSLAPPSSSASSSSSHPAVPPFSSSLSPPSSSSSSSSSWIPPAPLRPGAATSLAPPPAPPPDPITTHDGNLEPAGSELRGATGGRDSDPEHQHHHHHHHPDLASIPLWTVERFYDGLGADAVLERAWCRGFRTRLETVGRAVDNGLGDGWLEFARFD